ncbi:MAG TPA: zinc ribbon domain-containing protein [Candidatus Ruthenibacterium merdigallinarum]|nr:zinc ribbon domain-containing protein [Candidatus Ruthenibacterium merdigallinarum]
MEIFGKPGSAFNSTSSMVKRKAEDLAEGARLSSRLNARQEEKRQLLQELGEKCFSQEKDSPAPDFAELVKKLKEAEEQIQTLQAQLLKLKNQRTCPLCGTPVDSNAAFCPACGGKLPLSAPDAAAPQEACGRFCIFCGTTLDEEDLFCPVCGKKQEE